MNFWTKFKLITSGIWAYIESTIKWLGSRTGKILVNAAISACAQVAANPELVNRGNLAMRQAAFEIIVNAAKAEGKQLGIDFFEHEVNKAIEDRVFIEKDKKVE